MLEVTLAPRCFQNPLWGMNFNDCFFPVRRPSRKNAIKAFMAKVRKSIGLPHRLGYSQCPTIMRASDIQFLLCLKCKVPTIQLWPAIRSLPMAPHSLPSFWPSRSEPLPVVPPGAVLRRRELPHHGLQVPQSGQEGTAALQCQCLGVRPSLKVQSKAVHGWLCFFCVVSDVILLGETSDEHSTQ